MNPEQPGYGRIKAAILADLPPVRPLGPAWMWGWLMAALAAMVAGAGGWVLRPLGFDLLTPVQRGCIFGAAAGSAGLLANLLARGMFPGHRVLWSGLWAVVVAISVLPLALAYALRYRAEPDFIPAAWTCFRISVLLAAVTAPLLWAVLRQGAWMSPTLTGAACGALAGLAGMTALEIHCPNLDLNHVLAGHFAAVLVASLAGWTVAKLTP